MARCEGITKKSKRCKLPAQKGMLYCHLHQEQQISPNSSSTVSLQDAESSHSSFSTEEEKEQSNPNMNNARGKAKNPQLAMFIESSKLRSILLKVTRTRNQAQILLGIFLGVSLVSFLVDLHAWIYISDDVVIQLYSAISQALAALLGLLIAIRIFSIQFHEQIKSQAYDDFINEVDNLRTLVYEHPVELEGLLGELGNAIAYFSFLRLEDMPQKYDVWENECPTVLEELFTRRSISSPSTKLFYDHLLSTMLRVETSMNRIGVSFIGHKILIVQFKSIIPLMFLLALSLLLLLLFGTVDVQEVIPNLTLPTAIAFLCWLFFALIDLLFEVEMLVRNFEESWGWS